MARPRLYNYSQIGIKLSEQLDNRVREIARNAGVGISELIRTSLVSLWGNGENQERAVRRLKEFEASLPQVGAA